MAMKIHGVASSRTRRALWTAEEAHADYEFVKLSFSTGEHLSERYLKINPNGRVPALEDDGLVLFESAAICQYIARKYPQASLLPEPGSRQEALHDQWMFWTVTELEQALWSMGKHKFALPKEYRIEGMQKTALFEWHRAKKVLDAALEGRDHIVGDHITVADIMIGHTLAWARGFKVPFESDNLERYLDAMLARPSFEATKRWE
jgi:glutathione S-transferase